MKKKTMCERCQCKKCKERRKWEILERKMIIESIARQLIFDTLRKTFQEPKTFNEILNKPQKLRQKTKSKTKKK